MTRHSLGAEMIVLGWLLMVVRFGIHNHMQRIVARLAPPKTDRPIQNFREATDPKRVRREYERLFPDRAKTKFLWIRVTTIVAVIFVLIGIVLFL